MILPLLLLLQAAPIRTDALPAGQALIRGGDASCATAFSGAGNRDYFRTWALGVVSGLNVAGADHGVTRSTDTEGLLGEIELYCKDRPSEKFFSAVYAVYNRFRNENR